ncbi:EB domain-containing protein [Patescibacteria group bacterium]
MKNTNAEAPQTPKKPRKIGKILLIALAVVVLGGATVYTLMFSGGGGRLTGSLIQVPECSPNNIKGLTISDAPYDWWGITDEQCECNDSENWTINSSLPTYTGAYCDEAYGVSCYRLEQENTPCVCKTGFHLEDFNCVEDESSAMCIFSTPEIDYCTSGGTCIDNSHLEQNRCQCDSGYEFKEGKCEAETATVESGTFTKVVGTGITKSYVDMTERFPGTATDTKNVTQCADSSMNSSCICPDDTYFDSVNGDCVEITCDLDKQKVDETYNHNVESYDHTSVAGRAMLENYYKEVGSYADDCAEEEVVAEETTTEEEAAVEEEAEEETAEETAEEETAEEEEVAEEEVALTCDQLFALLSQAFRDVDWDVYESTMEALDADECFGYCESRFYWTVMYISLRDSIAARLYYDDENCTSCVMYNALAGYAAELMTDYTDFIETDAQMLRDLLESSLDYCEAPTDLQEFKDGLEFDDSMFFTYEEEAPKVAGIFSSFIPTAYAQSSDFSDDVDSVIDDVFSEKFELPELEVPPTPQCRSLDIVKPDAAVGDQPTILIPLSGYVNEELAILVDTDPNAVSLYRYKSLEATITFDNQGHIYDTIKTSVVMNHTDTSKGDIVTVWALDSEGAGIQECHDSFVVQINTPEPPPVVSAPATTYVPPVAAPPAAPVTSAPQVQQVVAPAPVFHAAAAPNSPENGPGMLLYLAGAGIGGALLRRRKK